MSEPDPIRRRLLAAVAALPVLLAPLPAAAAGSSKPQAARGAAPRRSARPAPSARPPRTPAPLLNTLVGARIEALRGRGLLDRSETVAFYVQDLLSGRVLLSINGSAAMQAASMVKPYVAAAFFAEVQAGRLRYDRSQQALMEAMIVHSDNDATNHFIRAVGGPARVVAALRRSAPGIAAGTSITEYIPAGGRTYRNRIACTTHARFLGELWSLRLPGARELLRVMGLPNRDRICSGAPGIPPGTGIHDKTGTTALLCGDMGIVVARTQAGGQWPYAFIGIVQRRTPSASYGRFMHTRGDAIRDISGLVYRELRPHYGLA